VRRFPGETADVERIFRRFDRHIVEVLEQTAGLRPAPWEEALSEAAERLDAAGAEWFLVGSAALAVRGIELHPRDIDIVTSDHRRAARAFADALIEPSSHDRDRRWIAAWFGRAFLRARVEWIAGVYDEVGGAAGPNEFGPAAGARAESVHWNGRALRLTPLDVQLAVNERRGLDERVGAIRAFVDKRPVAVDLGLR
jgi:hypothetical protein